MEIMQMKGKIKTLKLNIDKEMTNNANKENILEIFDSILEDWPQKSAIFFDYVVGFQKRVMPFIPNYTKINSSIVIDLCLTIKIQLITILSHYRCQLN